ncbi:MAG: carboxylating nicotinate-nucleotide diphosphorylase [Candidatus Marinimicrobia bacterium]|nr:carboxylating nicotinate-nucleotide diphosphorylase [Candidatus Neomarinimicrobiota bacterium]
MTDTTTGLIPDKYLSEVVQTIKTALTEDLGSGDITTLWTVSGDPQTSAQLIAKESGIVAGLSVAAAVFKQLDTRIEFLQHFKDGQSIKSGAVLATVSGSAKTLLAGERTALNFIQRMSGIASLTHKLMRAISHTKCKILDTRKTVPGLRSLDKWSVALGGGENHRHGLFDMVLIKENHIAMAGGITVAIESVLNQRPAQIAIEVEVKNLQELELALNYPIQQIMLDNMSLEDMAEACGRVAGRIPLEASGNVNASNIVSIAETGVDYISIGALTHSVKALDISLLITSP